MLLILCNCYCLRCLCCHLVVVILVYSAGYEDHFFVIVWCNSASVALPTALYKYVYDYNYDYDWLGRLPPFPPLGHVSDVMLVWRKRNINTTNCLLVTVLCTNIMVRAVLTGWTVD